jgi:hypothetical protein
VHVKTPTEEYIKGEVTDEFTTNLDKEVGKVKNDSSSRNQVNIIVKAKGVTFFVAPFAFCKNTKDEGVTIT